MAAIEKMPGCYSEPFGDSSQIPTYLVSALTKKHVTVALSGDGGDEIFAGYDRYLKARRLQSIIHHIPRYLRYPTGVGMNIIPQAMWQLLFKIIPQTRNIMYAGEKMHRLAGILKSDQSALYRYFVSYWMETQELVIGAQEPKNSLWNDAIEQNIPDVLQQMQYTDLMTYLPDDILAKVDFASMGNSLEVRVPMLDHRLLEFALRLPESMKIRHGYSKWILRQLLHRYVPTALVDRPKMGFGIPIDSWLRGPLKEWASDLLSQDTFKKHGLLKSEPILEKWREHQSGKRDWQYHLWSVLMLHAWADEYQ